MTLALYITSNVGVLFSRILHKFSFSITIWYFLSISEQLVEMWKNQKAAFGKVPHCENDLLKIEECNIKFRQTDGRPFCNKLWLVMSTVVTFKVIGLWIDPILYPYYFYPIYRIFGMKKWSLQRLLFLLKSPYRFGTKHVIGN